MPLILTTWTCKCGEVFRSWRAAERHANAEHHRANLGRRAGEEAGVSVVGFRAKNHPQQTGKRGANPAVDDRATSPEVFDALNARFRFTLDVAASAANTKCERYYSIEHDGLEQPWYGERVWCNPPYSDIRPWVEKAWAEWPYAELIVMLLPANRTEQAWWQELVEPKRDRLGYEDLRVEFLKGRLRFIAAGADGIGPNERPPFGCVLLIWERA